jgi:hypothetical protein
MADPAAEKTTTEDSKVDKSSEQKPQDNTSPGLDPTPDPKVQVSAVNPPITPDQVVSMAEAPSSAVSLPDVKLQNIKISPVKNKTIQGHLAAIEAKMIATEKLMKDIVKLQKHQIKTDKDLHHRRKELYQNTSQEFLLDKSIDFRDPKDKDCTCINIPEKKKKNLPLPIILPPGGGGAGAPVTPTVPETATDPVVTPNDPVVVPPTSDAPGLPSPPPLPPVTPGSPPVTPGSPPDLPDWLNPGGLNIPPLIPPVLPPFGLPGMPRADLPGDLTPTPTPGYAIDFSDPFDVPDWSSVDLGLKNPTISAPDAPATEMTSDVLKGLNVEQIWQIVQANINDPWLIATIAAAGGLALADGPAPFGEAGGVAIVMARLTQLLQKGKLIIPQVVRAVPAAAAALASGGIIPYASGGLPSGGKNMDLYHSKAQEYFRNVSSKLEIPKFVGGGFLGDGKRTGSYSSRPSSAVTYSRNKFAGGGIVDWWNKGRNVRVPNESKAPWRGPKGLLADDAKQLTRTNKAFKQGAKGIKGWRPWKAFSPNMVKTGPTPAVRQAFERPVRAVRGTVKPSHPLIMLAELIINELINPQPTSAYDMMHGPNAYYNAPGYNGPMPSQNLENAQNIMMDKTGNQQPQIVPLPPDYIKLPSKPKPKTYDTFEVPGIDLEPNVFTRSSRYID